MAEVPASDRDTAETARPQVPDAAAPQEDQAGRSRTATAGRAFFSAIMADLTAAWRGVAQRFRSAAANHRRPKADRPHDKRGSLWRGGAMLVSFIQGMAVAALVVGVVITGGILWALHGAPSTDGSGRSDRPSLVLETADGRPLGRAGPLVDVVARDAFPDQLVRAVVSIEDRRFYSHLGIDPHAMARAALANLRADDIVEGASTITQQLVRLRGFVGREQTVDRKLREVFGAIWLDFRMRKDAILTEYLNSVYLGAGAYGFAAAARTYFGKALPELSLAETAMLAGLIQAPSAYNPRRDLEAARQRAAQVLDAMVATGAIDVSAAESAKASPAVVKPQDKVAPVSRWFVDWIAAHEYPKLGPAYARSVKVRTTLVPELQQAAEQVVWDVLKAPGRGGPSQAALVAMRPDGAVVAMVGGRDYDESQFNRAADARRQPGSAFKLFVYLAALRQGYSPGDQVDASPIRIKRWEPENFGGRRYGSMTLEQSFAQSVNTAAVRLATEVGIDKVVAAARDLGIDAPLPAVPSLALGTAELTLLDLTGAFAAVRAGRRVDPFGITAFGPENEGLRAFAAPTGGELDHREQLVTLLRGVVTSGTGRAADTGGFVAGKTGTSQAHRDGWFIGFNETLVVGVWVGNDDYSPMQGVTGGALPAQIWRRFVVAANGAAQTAPPVPPQAAPASGRGEIAGASARGSAAEVAPPSADMSADARAQLPRNPSCNVDVCSRRYRSLDPSDCSYKPYGGGPRRICTADR